MKPIKPSKVTYIKLGPGGKWEQECIEKSHTLKIAFREADHAQCLAGNWQAIREHYERKRGMEPRAATAFANQIREFYEADETVLWITFYKRLLWWCFSRPVITRLPDKRKTRQAIGGWKCTSIDGERLTFNQLSEKLLSLRFYKGTICNVKEAKYVLKKINSGAKTVEADLDEAVVEALEKSQARSQGFQLDSKTRRAIEGHAMEAATGHFTSLGYTVEDHHKNHPYDLLCLKKKERLYVEVKGTVTAGDDIILTRGEVTFARSHKGEMGLFILHSIQVSAEGNLSNGQKKVILSWHVDKGRLKPVSFMYELPGSDE